MKSALQGAEGDLRSHRASKTSLLLLPSGSLRLWTGQPRGRSEPGRLAASDTLTRTCYASSATIHPLLTYWYPYAARQSVLNAALPIPAGVDDERKTIALAKRALALLAMASLGCSAGQANPLPYDPPCTLRSSPCGIILGDLNLKPPKVGGNQQMGSYRLDFNPPKVGGAVKGSQLLCKGVKLLVVQPANGMLFSAYGAVT